MAPKYRMSKEINIRIKMFRSEGIKLFEDITILSKFARLIQFLICAQHGMMELNERATHLILKAKKRLSRLLYIF